jgi:hypothetical protein
VTRLKRDAEIMMTRALKAGFSRRSSARQGLLLIAARLYSGISGELELGPVIGPFIDIKAVELTRRTGSLMTQRWRRQS